MHSENCCWRGILGLREGGAWGFGQDSSLAHLLVLTACSWEILSTRLLGDRVSIGQPSLRPVVCDVSGLLWGRRLLWDCAVILRQTNRVTGLGERKMAAAKQQRRCAVLPAFTEGASRSCALAVLLE